jgi:hypothetical protein
MNRTDMHPVLLALLNNPRPVAPAVVEDLGRNPQATRRARAVRRLAWANREIARMKAEAGD